MSIGIRKTFNLDMVPGGAPPIIHLSAEDVGRPYRANLLYDGEGYDLEDVTSVVIRGTKPDNTVFEYDLTFDVEDSHVDFNIKEQMAIIAGQVLCEIRLFSGDDTIGSANFILDVETAVYDPEAASESYIPTYETAIQEALENVADDIADLATAAAINDVKQYSDAASESATAAADSAEDAANSAAQAMSGTPDGYSALVSTVNTLTSNNDNFAVQAFPKAQINAAVDLNEMYIGDYACKDASYLTNAPSGLSVPLRITTYARTRDGLSDSDALTNNMYRTQRIIDANGKEYRRTMKRVSGGNVTWTDWQLLPTREEFDQLSDNTSATSAFMPFPKETIASNTDLNNVLIGDWYCSNNSIKNSLLNLPSGVGGVFRLQVISITRDGVTAPTEPSTWIRRVQILTDANGKIFLRFGSRENASTSLEWGAWKSLAFT